MIVLRLALGFVFLASGTAKILHPYAFLQDVYAYELVGADVGLIVAAVLPWLEMTLAACLLLGLSLTGALYVSSMLLGSFVIAQASVLIRGLEIGCACFGPADETDVVTWLTLGRTFLLLGLSVMASLLLPKALAAPPELFVDSEAECLAFRMKSKNTSFNERG